MVGLQRNADVHYELARVVKDLASTNTLPDAIPLSNNLRTTVGSLPSNSVTLDFQVVRRRSIKNI
jgi:hypothetical protein